MTIYQSAKEEIKRSADIVDLIGQFVQLKKAGRNYMGLCPFHAEKSPSFTVSRERQMFHCFGCKKGGDLFAFWMEYHGATFGEALRDLAERYGVTLSDGPSSAEEKRRNDLRDALYRINEKAATYFQGCLGHPVKGARAKEYLKRRGLTQEVIAQFRLGYAPDEWDGLSGFLKGQGEDLRAVVQAGLAVSKESGGSYDRFRGRVTFPIFNMKQQIIGFGGRVLDDSLPKYLNTPETPIFRKGEYPYGLHASHRSIREKGRVVVVEGYMDFLALWTHDLRETVATLGTALTGEHVRKIKGYGKEAVIVFDSDAAGQAAALRALPVLLHEGLPARALELPDGHDPDTFIRQEGLEGFSRLLEKASALFDFYLTRILGSAGSGVEGKVQVLKEILPVLSQLPNETQRSLYVRRLSEHTGIKEEVIWGELATLRGAMADRTGSHRLEDRLLEPEAGKRYGTDMHILNLLVHFPRTVPRLMVCEWRGLLSDPVVAEIVARYFERYQREGPFSPEGLMDLLESPESRRQFNEALFAPPFFSEQTVDLAVTELERRSREVELSKSIGRAKQLGDLEALNELLKLKAERSQIRENP